MEKRKNGRIKRQGTKVKAQMILVFVGYRILHYSNTPVLQYFNTPVLQYSITVIPEFPGELR